MLLNADTQIGCCGLKFFLSPTNDNVSIWNPWQVSVKVQSEALFVLLNKMLLVIIEIFNHVTASFDFSMEMLFDAIGKKGWLLFMNLP